MTNLYFRFETQQAKIFVSTLKCDPYDDSVTLDDLDSKIKDNSDNIDINTDNITKSAAGITTNAGGISTNAAGINTNAAGIRTSGISTNAAGINRRISTNAADIAKLSQASVVGKYILEYLKMSPLIQIK